MSLSHLYVLRSIFSHLYDIQTRQSKLRCFYTRSVVMNCDVIAEENTVIQIRHDVVVFGGLLLTLRLWFCFSVHSSEKKPPLAHVSGIRNDC